MSMDEVKDNAATPQDNSRINVVAVCFRNLISNSIYRLSRSQEKPYYYLDVHGCGVGDLALVHNGDNFGIVEVMRVIPVSQATALARVSKPVLCKVFYDEELLADASTRLKSFRDKTASRRTDIQIDRDLGLVTPTDADKLLEATPRPAKTRGPKGLISDERDDEYDPGDVTTY